MICRSHLKRSFILFFLQVDSLSFVFALTSTALTKVFKPISTNMTQTTLQGTSSNANLWARLNLNARTLESAYLSFPHDNVVTAVWSQRDPIAGKKRQFLTTHIPSGHESYLSSAPAELSPQDAANLHPSPSGRFYVRFITHTSPDSGLTAELWTYYGLKLSWPIDKSIHGLVYTDEWFGSVTWSPDERLIAYIADAPAPEQPNAKDVLPTSAWSLPLRHKYHADAYGPYGEGYTNRRSPALFVADTATGDIALAAQPSSLHLGQPQWSPGSPSWIVCTARPVLRSVGEAPDIPTDLGIRFCFNRPSSLVAFKAPVSLESVCSVNESCVAITDSSDPLDFCCTSPRFSTDGRDLVYVTTPRELNTRILPHNTAKCLRYVRVACNGTFNQPSTLISVPENPNLGEFPGIYLTALACRPWLNNDTLAFTTTWGCADRIVSVRFERHKGSLQPCTEVNDYLADVEGARNASTLAVDCFDGSLLVAVSNAATPTRLAIVHHKDNHNDPTIHLQWVTETFPQARALNLVSHSQHTATLIAEGTGDIKSVALAAREFDSTTDEASTAFQVLILLPTLKEEGKKTALAVFPHGGPHTASVAGYSVATSALLALGFAILFVNYRGSTGLGQSSLETLLGRVGTQDVNEVVQATRWALAQSQWALDAHKTVFVGGSHSGFLGAHISLVPKLFNRTVLRNPVVNISSMAGASDIPDWCFAEAGIAEDISKAFVPSPSQLAEMYERSPVAHVQRAKKVGAYPKTLLQVGGADRRVPPAQSLEWRRLLTATFGEGIVTMRWYSSSGHAIDDVPEGDDAWVHALDFLLEVFG